MAMTTLNSSDMHPKQRSQFISSIASDPSAPAASESFNATHVTSSSVKSSDTDYGTSPYSSNASQLAEKVVKAEVPNNQRSDGAAAAERERGRGGAKSTSSRGVTVSRLRRL